MVVYFCYGWKDTAIFSGHLVAVAPAHLNIMLGMTGFKGKFMRWRMIALISWLAVTALQKFKDW